MLSVSKRMKCAKFGIIAVFVLLESIGSWASITVPYQKPMLLGRTYDYSKSKVGNDIYPAAVRNNPLEQKHYDTKVKYQIVRNAKDKRDVLDISGHLSVQIMAGILDIKGSGSYLKSSSDSGQFVEVFAKIDFLTVTKSITDDKLPNPGWDKKSIIGQHYVRSITYGGNLIASLKFHAKNEKDMKNLEVKVEAGIKAKVFNVGIGGQFKKLAESVKDISTLTISYEATAPLTTVPTDIDSLVKAIADFPKVLKTIDGGKGVPIEAELIPLSQLSPSPKLQFLIDGSVQTRLTELESMYFDLRTTSDAIKKLLKRNPILKKKDEEDVGKFYSRIFKITETFNNVIAGIDLNIYTKKSGDQFQKAFVAYKDGSILIPDKYLREYNILEARIEPPVTSVVKTGLIAFHASLERSRYPASGNVKFDKIDFNIGSGLDNKTSVFTAPRRGVYQFMASVLPTPKDRSKRGRESVTFDIMKGKTTYTRVQSNPSAKSTQVSKTVLILLNKGENVNLRIVTGGGRSTSRYTTFGGYLVRAL